MNKQRVPLQVSPKFKKRIEELQKNINQREDYKDNSDVWFSFNEKYSWGQVKI